MNWLDFIASVIDALAWPMAAVAIAVLFRKPLRQVLPKLNYVKGFGAEAHFEQAAEELVSEIEEGEGRSLSTATKEELRMFTGERLSRAERLIVLLRYYHDLEFVEIAQTLDLPEPEVKRMHDEILEKFRGFVRDRLEKQE